MKKFYIIANLDKDPELNISTGVAEYLINHGASCECVGIERKYDDPKQCETIMNAVCDDTECVIVIGGDGTFIQVAAYMSKREIPMIGINLGRLGFLAEIEQDKINDTMDMLLEDKCFVEKRMMIHGRASSQKAGVIECTALNDVVITRVGELCVIPYEIYVNDRLLTSYNADGIIVSTPTGSTGYSMSAGGPIVEPPSSIMVITPISAHTFNSRSIVLSADDKVRIRIGKKNSSQPVSALMSADGGSSVTLTDGDYVDIQKAKEVTSVIKTQNVSFIDILARKMSS